MIVVMLSYVFFNADYRQKDDIKIEIANMPIYLEIYVCSYYSR